MKTVKYRNCYGVGENSDPWENINLEDFVRFVPDLGYSISMYQSIPPLAVLNDFFALGRANLGMSGSWIWKIFSIDIAEYEDLVEILYTDPKFNMKEERLYQELTKYKVWNKLMFRDYANNKRIPS